VHAFDFEREFFSGSLHVLILCHLFEPL
jgi:hypothetical protein